MKNITDELESLINDFPNLVLAIPEDNFCKKPAPQKWSKKEILGHLIDSGLANLQRFVRSQFEDQPKIVYDQNNWVKFQNYQNAPTHDILALWVSVNNQIALVLKSMPMCHYGRCCDTGVDQVELKSLSFLAEDYIRHMRHHFNQILA
jgi:hypothetical protein